MSGWKEMYRKANPAGRPKKDKKRPPVNATVHPNVREFFDECEQEHGLNPGRMIDKLVSEKYPSVKIGDEK